MNSVLKILILEDSPADAEIVKRLLIKEKSPCEFVLAMNEEAYREALEVFKPDVILSDHSLPRFDSASALTLARQKLPDVPFIMVTGAVSEEFAADIIRLGADDYILKDRLNRLPSAIDAVLKQRKWENDKKEADQKIIESENSLRAIFENTSEGFLLIDSDGIVRAFNRKMEEYINWGSKKQVETGKPAIDVIDESRKDFFKLVVDRALSGETVEYERFYDFENGNVKWVDFSVTPVKDGDVVTGICIAGRNITERKIAEQQLKSAYEQLLKSETRLNEAQAITHISNWEIDLENNIHTWSDEMYRILGLNKTETIPTTDLFLSFIHPDDAVAANKYVREAFEQFNDSKIDFRFLLNDGKKRYGHIEWRFAFNKAGRPFRLFGILQDITESKEAEKTLKGLEKKIQEQKMLEQKKIARAIITGQEKERNHIAQELHDNINQILAGTKMFLSVASKKNDEIKGVVKYPMELIDSSIEEIRLLSQKLVIPQKSIKLNKLVEDLLNKLSENTSVQTSLTYTIPDATINEDLKLNIYRIIQEQLTNIQKYAQAKNVEIVMILKGGFISISIADDGKGFNTHVQRKGIGISNIIYRAECFGGKVSVKSSPGKGCKLQVKIPY